VRALQLDKYFKNFKIKLGDEEILFSKDNKANGEAKARA